MHCLVSQLFNALARATIRSIGLVVLVVLLVVGWLVRSGVRHVPMAQWAAAAKKQQNIKLNEIYCIKKRNTYIQNIGSGLASTISPKACMLSLGHTNSASQFNNSNKLKMIKQKNTDGMYRPRPQSPIRRTI